MISRSFAFLTLIGATTLLDQASGLPCRRRFLSAIASSTLQEDDMIDMLKSCNDVDYKVAASIVGTHLGMTAIPNQVSEQCPILFLHDNFGKQIDTSTDTFFVKEIPQYEIGSFSLNEILEAFEKASDTSTSAYDLMENNCGTVVISMMDGLDVPITADHIAFVAENLFDEDSENWISSQLRSHTLFASLFPRGDLTPDLGLLYEFVAEYVESHRGASANSQRNLESHRRESHQRKLKFCLPRGFLCF